MKTSSHFFPVPRCVPRGREDADHHSFAAREAFRDQQRSVTSDAPEARWNTAEQKLDSDSQIKKLSNLVRWMKVV